MFRKYIFLILTIISISALANQSVEEVLSSITDEGIVVKESGMYRIFIERSTCDKIKSFFGLDHEFQCLLGKLLRLNKNAIDCSTLMGRPCLLVTSPDAMESIKKVLEEQGYKVQVKQMPVVLSY